MFLGLETFNSNERRSRLNTRVRGVRLFEGRKQYSCSNRQTVCGSLRANVESEKWVCANSFICLFTSASHGTIRNAVWRRESVSARRAVLYVNASGARRALCDIPTRVRERAHVNNVYYYYCCCYWLSVSE